MGAALGRISPRGLMLAATSFAPQVVCPITATGSRRAAAAAAPRSASMQAAAEKAKLRVLCLHSFRTSASILRQQFEIAGWEAEGTLGDLCDFTFVDSPHPSSGAIPPDVSGFFEPPYYEWWNATTVDGALEYVGLEQSLANVQYFVEANGPYDGVLGFSQGATLTGMMAAMGAAENRGPFAAAAGAGAGSVPFAMLVSGMLARTEGAKATYAAAAAAAAGGATTPSLHIIGEADRVMPPVMSERAAAAFFSDPVIVRHERGHVVPRLTGEALKKVRGFLTSMQQARAAEEQGTASAL